jgi:hypothetical protein
MAYLIEAVALMHGEIGESFSEEVVATAKEVGTAVTNAMHVGQHDAVVIQATSEEPHPFETHEQANARRFGMGMGLMYTACQYFDSITGMACNHTPVVAKVTYLGQSTNYVCSGHASFYRRLNDPHYAVEDME